MVVMMVTMPTKMEKCEVKTPGRKRELVRVDAASAHRQRLLHPGHKTCKTFLQHWKDENISNYQILTWIHDEIKRSRLLSFKSNIQNIWRRNEVRNMYQYYSQDIPQIRLWGWWRPKRNEDQGSSCWRGWPWWPGLLWQPGWGPRKPMAPGGKKSAGCRGKPGPPP